VNIQELGRKLDDNRIPKSWYLINDGTKSDTHILEEYIGLWKYYYLDEKGNIRNECHFKAESDACQYFYDKLLEIHNYFKPI
jgi:hypothetical protein